MITTDAALYGAPRADVLLAERPAVSTLATCSCGQELQGVRREHCPRCGCTL